MITPDAKDWTWVLDRPCPECGFDASTTDPAEVANLVHANAAAWRSLFDAGFIAPGRPDDRTWSSLEYACHVRDVYERYRARIELMLAEDYPLFPNWDQDASAVDEAYEQQQAPAVLDAVDEQAAALATCLDRMAVDQWARPGRRSDGAVFTIGTIARYMVHDTIHHVWDVERSKR